MERIFNFSAGPAVLPREVLEQAAREMLSWHACGMSVMEMSHRGAEYLSIHREAEASLRELLAIPSSHRVLFLQGGASGQFSMIPMNLLRGKRSADYLLTGHWSERAMAEARRYCQVKVVASSQDRNFSYVPAEREWKRDPDAAYLHITPNETIGGVEMFTTPDSGNVPLVADMSSTLLSRPVDVSRYGLIYAGAQKNIGPAGLVVVIVREDLMGPTLPGTPALFDYRAQADSESMINTPPTFAVYIAGLVFGWLKRQGGLAAMERRNQAKAKLLYDLLDASDFYRCPTALQNRSRMNVPFTLKDPALDDAFLAGATQQGLVQLKGHRSVGGMRASIYNAMPMEGVQALTGYMKTFEANHA